MTLRAIFSGIRYEVPRVCRFSPTPADHSYTLGKRVQLCVSPIDHSFRRQNLHHVEMANLETRTPKHNDTVTVEGRTGSFPVIGVDTTNKTVEVRATVAPFVVLIAPWATLSYVG